MSSAGDRLIMTKMRAARQIDKEMRSQIEKVFELLDPFDLDMTYGPFEAAFVDVITAQSGKFLTLEQAFLKAYCAVEFGMDVAVANPSASLIGWEARDRIASSLQVVTSASIKAQTAKAQSVEKAATGARKRAVGVGMRHARSAARSSMQETVRDNKELKGYKRIPTGAETCGFCNLLADRGAVYDAESVAFKSHDMCDCEGVPAIDGPKPTMDQAYIASARKDKHSDADKERLKAAIADLES